MGERNRYRRWSKSILPKRTVCGFYRFVGFTFPCNVSIFPERQLHQRQPPPNKKNKTSPSVGLRSHDVALHLLNERFRRLLTPAGGGSRAQEIRESGRRRSRPNRRSLARDLPSPGLEDGSCTGSVMSGRARCDRCALPCTVLAGPPVPRPFLRRPRRSAPGATLK
jgi:hypothetical protein